jgi:aspartate-semialdehyde dehydrogenase
MARTSADPAALRIAVLGAASPTGAHLKAALADRGVPGGRVALFGLQREVAVLSEYDGEARLVQAADELDAASYAAIFVCEIGHDVQELTRAAASGTLVVDMTGSVAGAVLNVEPVASTDARLVAAPHAVTLLLAGLLSPIHRAIGVTRVAAFVLRPTSDFGEAGLEELREQTVHLLRFEPTPTEVFGRQLAFNVLPEHLFPQGEDDSAPRVVRETRTILGTPDLPIALSQALVPVFFGHAIAVHVELVRAGRAEALAAWGAAPGVEVATDQDTGATLDAPDASGIVVSRVDQVGDTTLRVWALGSEAGPTAAARALAAAIDAGIL